jgi:hypothetical protein
VEDVVAVTVTLDNGERRYFMTWGRIQNPVDPDPLAALVLRHAVGFDLGGRPVAAEVCPSLRDARQAPYFYEALVSFGRCPILQGDGYEAWKRETSEAMESGRELYYLGRDA